MTSLRSVATKARLVFLKKLNVHPEKCREVQFSSEVLPGRERFALLLASSTVKVIDYPVMEVIYSEVFSPTAPIKSIRFLDDRPRCLVLGLKSAELIIVDLSEDPTKKKEKSGRLPIKVSQEELTDMDVSRGRAVMGCSKGSVAIVDLRTWKVLAKHKLFNQIRAVKWSRSGDVAAAVAVGEKGLLIIHDAAEQASSYMIKLPAKVCRFSYVEKGLLSASVCWAGGKLVVSTPSGTLYSGEFQGENTKLEPITQELLSKSICTLCPVAPGVVFTTGIDHVFALWDVSSENRGLLRCDAGVAGFVYDLAFHPAGTGVLAVATGFGNVLLAKTDQGSLAQVGKHLQLRCRAYTVAWHPTNEMQLAVGTQDGKVLVFDVSSQKTNVFGYHTKQRTGIGSVAFASLPLLSEWPVLLATDNNQAYFSKEKDGLLQRLDLIVNGLENHKVWCVSVVPQKNLILFGSAQGKTIAVDSLSLQIVAESRPEKHALTSLAVSSNGNFVAAVFSSTFFSVFETEQLRHKGKSDGNAPCEPIEAKFHAVNHSCMALCWSPFDENLFAIAGTNGEVKLWNLEMCCVRRVFYGAAGNKTVLTMAWSPIAEHRLYLGTNTNSLYQLDMDTCGNQESVDCAFEVDLNLDKPAPAPCKGPKKPSMFPSSSVADDIPKAKGLEDLLLLLSCEECGDYSPLREKPHMGFFHKDLLQGTIDKEVEQHVVKMNSNMALQLMLTGGDIRTTVEFAKEQKHLTPRLVALSAFVSKDFFDETVSAFIDQKKESDIHSVLPFMMATGRTEELLQLLCDLNFHRDAAAVALSNFERDHPAVKKVYMSWAARYTDSAHYERAARCFLVAGEKERMVDTLTLYQDAKSAATAAICAKRCSLPSELLLLKAVRKLLASADGSLWLSRLAEEFEMPVVNGLETLCQTVRTFYRSTKPTEESDEDLFSVPTQSFDEMLESYGSLFSQDDADFVKRLQEGAQLVQTIDELQAFITLEVASSLISTGSVTEAAKVRISQKVAQFDSGKYIHFVMGMLCTALPSA
ncbi:hypothetical protein BIW11_05828 [Tropilaelaps mercedesae]|uniref:Gem-associated protein 5 TPR domain-containing protein n=1 Tax=Tropilaelaps mercedesae TaxID=418985 RepID=A0A1V9Y0R3_9ACAR|nr:hypothetical protein BIW11_05828 [Tropilaelaps mercedesae]